EGVPVINMVGRARVDRHDPLALQSHLPPPAGDLFDDAELSVHNPPGGVWRAKLHPVADGEIALGLAVDAHARQPPRVIGDLTIVFQFDGDRVLLAVARDNLAVVAHLSSASLPLLALPAAL